MGNKFYDHQPEPNGSGFLERWEGLLLRPCVNGKHAIFHSQYLPWAWREGEGAAPPMSQLESCSKQQYTLGGIAGHPIHTFFFLLSLEFFFFFLTIFFLSFYLFIYFWLRWVFVAACRLFLVAASGGYSLLQCAGFSLWWLLLLRSTGSRHAGFSSCGTRASVVVAHRL